jgi:hypothetical protein
VIDDERARAGLDHLQAAALEAIAATRAFLDVAEELVKEPGALGEVVRTVGAIVSALRPDAGSDAAPTPPGDAGSGDGDDGPSSGVRRVPVT